MENITSALILTLLGMGWVFLFLGILVIFMSLMSVLARFLPQEEVAPAAVSGGSSSGSSDAEVVAAITAAKAYQNSL